MPFHSAGAEEEFGADLGVGAPLAGQFGDPLFLGSQVCAVVFAAFADLFAGNCKFAARSRGKGVGAHQRKELECRPQLGSGLGSAVFAAQPLPIAQPCPCQVGRHAGLAEPLDRLAEEVIGYVAVG